ncbi:MAG: hypothetical protein Kow00120_10740 [Anaerolineae bacterium]
MGKRIGFHYYDDQDHFTAADLDTWLPRLEAMGASWLVLRSSLERMAPEFFIDGLLAAGVEPVVRIPAHPIRALDLGGLRPVFEAYQKWGVRYVVLFEQANSRAAWSSADWARPSLVDRCLDCLLPVLNAMSAAGLTPVLPPLVAGGDYWDTAFLDGLLAGLVRRGYEDALRDMAVGIFHFTGNRPLDWGQGGPEAWPSAQPYLAPPGAQDQRGFHRYEWIDAIVRRHVGASLDQLVVAGGAVLGAQDLPEHPPVDPLTHAQHNLEIARRMDAGQTPPYVLNTAFWLLAAAPGSPAANAAWWPPGSEEPLPAAARLVGWAAETGPLAASAPIVDASVAARPAAQNAGEPADAPIGAPIGALAEDPATPDKPLEHYVLLPALENGAGGYWEAVRGYVSAFRPVCGFSPHEAACARHVTVVGDLAGDLSTLEADLRAAGCLVQCIEGADSAAVAQALQARVEAGEPYGPPAPFAHRPNNNK